MYYLDIGFLASLAEAMLLIITGTYVVYTCMYNYVQSLVYMYAMCSILFIVTVLGKPVDTN